MAPLKDALRFRLAVRRSRSEIKRLEHAGPGRHAGAELGEAYVDLGESLCGLARFSASVGALSTADRILSEAGDRRRATQVRLRLAGVLMVLGRNEEALVTVDELIASDQPRRGEAEELAIGYLWRVVALQELGRPREALSGARRLVKRYAPGGTAVTRQIVAKALLLESQLALGAGEPAAALRAANRVLSEYADDSGVDTQESVAAARVIAAQAST